MKKAHPHVEHALNGLSIHSLSINQEGDLEVEFDLPQEQTTESWYTYRRASRILDVYEDDELQEACRDLFRLVRERLFEPDEEQAAVHCDRCATSSCCRKYNVLLRDGDIERLATHLGLSAPAFVKKYTDAAVDWCGDFARQLACEDDEEGEEGEEKCVFLKETDSGLWRCSVYEHRPRICRDFDMKTCDDFVCVEDVEVVQEED